MVEICLCPALRPSIKRGFQIDCPQDLTLQAAFDSFLRMERDDSAPKRTQEVHHLVDLTLPKASIYLHFLQFSSFAS